MRENQPTLTEAGLYCAVGVAWSAGAGWVIVSALEGDSLVVPSVVSVVAK